ncbi:MAG: lipopolysaccharide kinase InaA family protein [Marinobacter sp.]|uniref:lipopolysaccharide kinase InaA family protein n=1 Tax=Marinobacter sp. TaxID=50741 RepID=UPI00329764EB
MATIEFKEELHSNIRRTRITYRALVDGQEVAVKCYRKPLFGLIHWLRALRRGKKIRRAGGPVPGIVYAGWVQKLQCFGFATEFLSGYRSMREVLRSAYEQSDQARVLELLDLLGRCVADLHKLGIEQLDCNLTNYLINADNVIRMVDEDDVRLHPRGLNESLALTNLANLGARLPPGDLPRILHEAYLDAWGASPGELRSDPERFEHRVFEKKQMLRIKRAARDAAPDREFD